MRARAPFPLGAAALVLLLSAAAAGQTPGEQKAAVLFREGRAALDAGDHAVACPKFEESLTLLRRPGTLLNLATCDEKKEKNLVRAIARLEDALTLLEPNDERAAFARKEIERLEGLTARYTFRLAAGAPGGTRAHLDGKELALGAPQRLEPGEHHVVINAAGRPDTTMTFQVAAGEAKEIELAPAAEPRAPAPPPPVSPPPDAGRPLPRRTIGFVVGGVGVAGVAVGAVTGIMTIGKKGEVEDNCVGGCNDASRDAADAGKTLSTISTITFIAGAAALGAGVVLVVTDRGASGATVGAATALSTQVHPNGGGLTLTRSF